MKRIAFRTMGGRDIGYGHLYRCLSLAKALSREAINCKIIFIVNKDVTNIIDDYGFERITSDAFIDDYQIIEDSGFDLVIIDSYRTNDSYLRAIKKTTKLMLFDDNNNLYDSEIPDIVLNGNIHAEDLNYNRNNTTCFLLGVKYLVMREDYWNDSSNETDEKKGVLVTTGGSDTLNISPKILKELIKTDFEIKVAVGPGYSDQTIDELYRLKNHKTTIVLKPDGLKEYIKYSKYVITASGSTVYEVISQKSIPIIFTLADNQEIAHKYFKELGIESIGQYPGIRYNEIIQALKQTGGNNTEKIYNLIDGKGALRVAHQIMQILSCESINDDNQNGSELNEHADNYKESRS